MTHTQEIYKMSELSYAEWEKLISALPEREQFVLANRCGQSEIWTLKKLAERFSVTNERIRQIENTALKVSGIYAVIHQKRKSNNE